MLRLTTPAVALLVFVGRSVEVQSPAALVGRWERVEAVGPSTNTFVSEVLTVRAVPATGAGSGTAMRDAPQVLTIERRVGAETTNTTVQIGLAGGVTEGISLGMPRAEVRSQWSSKWVDAHLIFWRRERTVTGAQIVEIETTDDWSVNNQGQLVIATRVHQTGQAPLRTVRVYRRQ